MARGERLYGEKAPELELFITQELIDWAIAGDASRCAIARALLNLIPYATFIKVDIQTLSFTDPMERKRHFYLMTRLGQHFIRLFDDPLHRLECQPFKLHLKPENATTRAMSSRRGSDELPGARDRRRRKKKREGCFAVATMRRTDGLAIAMHHTTEPQPLNIKGKPKTYTGRRPARAPGRGFLRSNPVAEAK